MTALGWRPLQRLMISMFNIRLVKSESYKEKHGPEPKLAGSAKPLHQQEHQPLRAAQRSCDADASSEEGGQQRRGWLDTCANNGECDVDMMMRAWVGSSSQQWWARARHGCIHHSPIQPAARNSKASGRWACRITGLPG